MVNLSVLDVFILSSLSRGLDSPYDLQREAGVSMRAGAKIGHSAPRERGAAAE